VVFDLFFRKNPFKGEFTVFAGVDEVLRFMNSYSFSKSDIAWIRAHPSFTDCEEGFFTWLENLDMSQVTVHAMREGTLCFPKEPLMMIEGPLGSVQLLETTLLNLVNYPSLMATNAARFRLAAGPDKQLLEFGLRRAQGPNGALSATSYAYLGGFDATSNCLAGKLFGIGVKGTHAHSFVTSYTGIADCCKTPIKDSQGVETDFIKICFEVRDELEKKFGVVYTNTNQSELAAFIDYAQAYPRGFLALIDTYDVLYSGLRNYIVVALALCRIGYRPLGVRLDSGDLAYLSKEVRAVLTDVEKAFGFDFSRNSIVASNDINESVILSLNRQGHSIDVYGIGTHLVTCQAQPALGCVFKLVEIKGQPRIKLSNEAAKVTIPGRKSLYRLFGKDGYPIADLMTKAEEPAPKAGQRVMCRHPFNETKRVYVVPAKVESLYETIWDGQKGLEDSVLKRRVSTVSHNTNDTAKQYVKSQIDNMREDHLRPLNPTPYKVSVSEQLYEFLHALMSNEAPIKEIS